VATDTNGDGDVFLRDLGTSTARLVPVNASGSDSAHGLSDAPVFSTIVASTVS
jgi:hypothetical protein